MRPTDLAGWIRFLGLDIDRMFVNDYDLVKGVKIGCKIPFVYWGRAVFKRKLYVCRVKGYPL